MVWSVLAQGLNDGNPSNILRRRDDLLVNGGVHIGGPNIDRQLSLAGVMPLLGYRSKLKREIEMPSSCYMNLATCHTINQAYTRQTWADLQQLHLVSRRLMPWISC